MISYNHIIKLIVTNGASETHDSVNKLLQEIVILDQKFKNLDKQSFYFQKAIESHQQRFKKMKEEYQQSKFLINNHDLDFFIQCLNEKENDKKELLMSKKYLGFLLQIKLASIEYQIEALKDSINCKKKYGKLKDIEEIINDETYLEEVFKIKF